MEIAVCQEAGDHQEDESNHGGDGSALAVVAARWMLMSGDRRLVSRKPAGQCMNGHGKIFDCDDGSQYGNDDEHDDHDPFHGGTL